MPRTVIAHVQVDVVEEDGKLLVEVSDSVGPLPPLVPLINGPTITEPLSLSAAMALVGEAKDVVAKLLSAKKAG